MMSFSKSIAFVMIVGLLAPADASAQQAKENLAKADSLYEVGQKKKARNLYERAANEGSADAHFALAYKYPLSKQQRIDHFATAAKEGHGEALEKVLDELLFRANGLTEVEPQRALDLYCKAKKANPNLNLFNEQQTAKTLKQSALTADFNAQHFIDKYDVTKSEADSPWKLAEEASCPGGRFGKPDPKVVLALVVRGGFAPAARMAAVDSVYQHYQNGIVKPFNICDYVTSGYGMSFCASRDNKEDSSLRQARLDSLKTGMHTSTADLVQKAYDLSAAFIEAKAEREEQHGGSGRGAWIIQSEMKQKHAFLSLIDSVQHGFKPSPDQIFKQADKQLNQTYQKAQQVLSKEDQPFQYFTKPKDLRAVQRLWIPYRDTAAAAFHQINPEVDLSVWKAWLTERRINQLREIPGME